MLGKTNYFHRVKRTTDILLKITRLFVLLFIFGSIVAIHAHDMENFEDSSEPTVDSTMKYVILDTDMGADDAWALQMLLNAAKKMKNVEVLAITTVYGNTNEKNVIKNTYRILDGLNRTDVRDIQKQQMFYDLLISCVHLFPQIPIYEGATEALVPIDTMRDNFFGGNGFSDIDIWQSNYPSDINSLIQQQKAVEIIRELVMKVRHAHYKCILSLRIFPFR